MKTLFLPAVSLFLILFPLLFIGCLMFSLRFSDAQLERGGATPFEELPEELRDLSPIDCFIPSYEKVSVIHTLGGNVVVIHGAGKQAWFGIQGDPIYKEDTPVTFLRASDQF